MPTPPCHEVPLPACCASFSHGVNTTTKTGRCLSCGADFTFDGKVWIKVEKSTSSPDPKPAK